MASKSKSILKRPAWQALDEMASEFLRQSQHAASRSQRNKVLIEPEALHDFRVGLRRLRSLLQSYDELLSPTGRKASKNCRRLARSTNNGRDIEVALGLLHRLSLGRRGKLKAVLEQMIVFLKSCKLVKHEQFRECTIPTFRKLLARWKKHHKSYFRIARTPSGSDSSLSYAVVAGRSFTRQTNDFKAKRLTALTSMTADDLHKLRVACKQLRYFAEPLVELPTAKELVTVAREIQDTLGNLRDACFTGRLVSVRLEEASLDSSPHLDSWVRLRLILRAEEKRLLSLVDSTRFRNRMALMERLTSQLGKTLLKGSNRKRRI